MANYAPEFELGVNPPIRRYSNHHLNEDGEVKVSPSPRMSTLHQAASGNQDRVLSSLISLKNNDVNRRDDLDRTPLMIGAKKGFEKIVKVLLETSTIDVHARAKGGITALHLAAFGGHAAVVQLLVSRANLELLHAQTSEEHFTAMHMAASKGGEAVVRSIWEAYKLGTISETQLVEVANARDCIGWTPLHYAAWEGRTNVVEELLSWTPVDVNAEDVDGFTALHLASWRGYREIVTLILNHLDPEKLQDVKPNKLARSNSLTRGRITSLQKDVDWENLPRPKLADYIIEEHRDKVTPLHYAVEQDQEEVVAELLQDSSTDVHLENSDQKSAFDMAMAQRNGKVLWLLLGSYREKFEVWENLRNVLSRRGFKNFIPKGQQSREKKLNFCGELLKNSMEKSKHEEVVFLLKELETELLQMNVQIEQNDKKGVSLLHHAAFAGLDRLVEILANIPGMEINCEDSEMQTPLHYAAVAGRASVVRVLIERPNCRANAEDKYNRTALQVASESGKHDVEKLLLDRADVRDYVDRFYRDRQVYVDAANAMLLGAALIASVTFAGWLQPPAGFTPYQQLEVQGIPGSYESYASVEQHLSTRVFWIFNSLSFFFSIATVIAGAGAVLPTLDVFISQEVRLVKRTLVATSTLLVFSVVFILGAFGAAGYASLPPIPRYQKNMTYTVIPGVFLCVMSMIWFLRRLYGIRPSWWRRVEEIVRPRQAIERKIHSARDLFRKPRPG